MKIFISTILFLLYLSKSLYAQNNQYLTNSQITTAYDSANMLYAQNKEYQALEVINKFEKQLRNCAQDSLVALAYYRIGAFYFATVKDMVMAMRYFEKTFTLRKILFSPPHTEIGRSLYMLGVCQKELGQYLNSRPYLEDAKNVFQQTKDTLLLALASLHLGSTLGYLGDNENGKLNMYTALNNYTIKKDIRNVMRTEGELGILFTRKKLYDSAIVHLAKNLNLLHTIKDSEVSLGDASANYSIALQGTDSLSKALDIINQAIGFYNKAKQTNSDITKRKGNAYIELGNIHRKRNEDSLAKVAYDSAIVFFLKDTGLVINPYHAEAYEQLATLLSKQNKNVEALYFYNQALQILVPNFKFNSSNPLATPSVKTGSYAPIELLKTLSAKSRAIYQLLKQPEAPPQYGKAFQHILKQIDTVYKDLRLSFVEDRSKADLVETLLPVFQDAISTAYWKGDMDLALHYFEQNKSVALRELLQDNIAQMYANIDTATLYQEQQLKMHISYCQKQYLEGNIFYTDSLVKAKEALIRFNKEVERNYPKYYDLKYKKRNIDIATIQSKLPSEMVFIEYFWGVDSVFCMAISSKKVVLKSLKIDSLEHQIKQYINCLTDGDNNITGSKKIFVQYSHLLYKKLVAAVLDSVNTEKAITRVKIVPDGILNYLPFETLFEKPHTDWTASSSFVPPYLLLNYAISYDFSANIAFDSVYHTSTKPKQWLGVGLSYEYEYKHFPNSPKIVTPLTYAIKETENIKNIFPEARILTDVLPQNTTKNAILTQMPYYNYQHFSVHGLLDEREPLQSALVFSRTDIKNTDFLLTASEIYGQNFGTDKMAVLSACNTGRGILHRGEGLMCLGRAFAYSGYSTLILTNWSVNEVSTSNVLTPFYRYLSEGLSKDIALQKAKIDYLKTDYSKKGISKAVNPTIPNRWSGLKIVGKVDSVSW